MNKEFIPYEEALALKELGLELNLRFGYWKKSGDTHQIMTADMKYDPKKNLANAPLYQQAFRWFRKEYNKLHTVNIDLSNNLKDKVYVYTIEDHLGSIVDRSEEYKTHEEAELACLRKLIEIVKEKL